MPAAADRLEFAPPPQPAAIRGFAIAVIAHLLLAAALTWGVNWKNDPQEVAVDAELWSRLPQEAAPREVPAPPAPPPPVVQAPPKPEPPPNRDAEIALEREKKAAEAKQRREEELEREALRRKQLAAKEARDLKEAKRKAEEQQKLEAQRVAVEARKKEAAEKKRKEQAEEQKLAKLREDNLRRIQGMAGAAGSPSAAGTAQQASGPSASWGGRVQARVRPNIVFSDDIAGNPSADVEVRLAPDGTIVSRRLAKSSGNKAWDDAVLRALDKTEILPRDTDGRVPPQGVIAFRPKG